MLLICKAAYSGSIGTSLFEIKWHARKESFFGVKFIYCVIFSEEMECYYYGEVRASGASFNATDNCNTCQCNNGQIACTLMYCPPGNREIVEPYQVVLVSMLQTTVILVSVIMDR